MNIFFCFFILYRLRNGMYIFCINAIKLFNVIASLYKYTRIGTTDVTDWLLIIGQSPFFLQYHVQRVWTSLHDTINLSFVAQRITPSMQAVYYYKLLFNYYTIMIFKLMKFWEVFILFRFLLFILNDIDL